jgi:hypothetical protein
MPLGLIKVCVGAQSIEDLRSWQDLLVRQCRANGVDERPYHDTRSYPKRADEILPGGSMYWIIKKRVRVRQRITALERIVDPGGSSICRIFFDPALVEVEPRPRKPFQGWRYLEAAVAPRDREGAPDLTDLRAIELALKDALVW